jgi:alpha-galactosidase
MPTSSRSTRIRPAIRRRSAHDSSDLQILVKTLASGEKAVAIFNRGAGDYDVDLNAGHLKFSDDAPIELTDLWSKQRTTFTKRTQLHVKPRETLIFRAHGTRALQGGYYLSEQPGSVNPAVDGVVHPTPDPSIFRTAAGGAAPAAPGDRPSYAGWGGARADSAPYGQVLHDRGQAVLGGPWDPGKLPAGGAQQRSAALHPWSASTTAPPTRRAT